MNRKTLYYIGMAVWFAILLIGLAVISGYLKLSEMQIYIWISAFIGCMIFVAKTKPKKEKEGQ